MTGNTHHAVMVGKRCPDGPYGRDCPCCGQAPGRERTIRRRLEKRRERQALRRMTSAYVG